LASCTIWLQIFSCCPVVMAGVWVRLSEQDKKKIAGVQGHNFGLM